MSLPRSVADVLKRARDSGSRRHRPHVPQRLSAPVADRPRRRRLLPLPPWRDLRLLGAHGPHEQVLHRRRRSLRRAGTDPPDHLRQGAAQGRRRQGVPRLSFHGTEGIVVRRQGSGEDAGLPHRETPQSPDRPDLSLDRAKHGHGQPLLLLRHRRGLRPVLPQVLHLFPLQRQALHQRPRVRQATTGQGRDRLRGPGQRRPELRRPATAAATLRRALGATRSTALLRKWLARLPHPFTAQGSSGRLSLRHVDPPGRVLPDPGPGPAARPAASSSRR